MLHQLYSSLGSLVYLFLLCLRPLVGVLGSRIAYKFSQRLGRYPEQLLITQSGCQTIWLHASSVGEMQAALILVHHLLNTGSDIKIVVSSTTEQGNRFAKSKMPATVVCLMAPLDMPQAVRAALNAVQPTCYICLETELWPVMLTATQQAQIPMVLLNGRMSHRSCVRYRCIKRYMASLLGGFSTIAVITETDAQRYAALGVPTSRIQVCGNMKYDLSPPHAPDKARTLSRQRLCAHSERVFICGSTHEDEEAQLIGVFRALLARGPALWVLAPRHLERLPALEALLLRSGLQFDRFSKLAENGRSSEVVLVDTIGDLADLYAAGDYIFCGGSLVDRGGHNIIEASRWGRAVHFGPHMKNFQDVAEMLLQAGGGFQVAGADELSALLLSHLEQPDQYALACTRAAEVAVRQSGAVSRQADIVRQVLASC